MQQPNVNLLSETISLFSVSQRFLMDALQAAWDRAKETRSGPDLAELVHCAHRCLQHGDVWPHVIWVEEILKMGATGAYHAVLGHGLGAELKGEIGDLYQEVLDRRWIEGGPHGHFGPDDNESYGLALARTFTAE